MIQTNKSLFLLALFVLSTCFTLGAQLALEADADQLKKYMNTITEADLKKHLYILASDDYEGRETATKAQEMAAHYISKHFKDNGLTGPVVENPNPYLQIIPFRGTQIMKARMENENASLDLSSDIVPVSLFNLETTKNELIFLGYAMDTEETNDFADVDINGKGVVMLAGEPGGADDGRSNWQRMRAINNKVAALRDKGAAFVVITYSAESQFKTFFPFYKSRFVNKPRLSMDLETEVGKGFPQLMASPSKIAELFGESTDKFMATIEKYGEKGKPMGGLYTTSVELEVKLANKIVTSSNVLGFLEGTDLKDEILVITAHYDHVGINGGEVYNGADDDGSGTVGVLELVSAFGLAAEDGVRPRRSILFMTVTGEEKGLLGSRYYTDQDPIFDLGKTITNLNIDMIGRVDEDHVDDRNYVYIIGSTMLSTELHNVHEKVSSTYVPEMNMDYKYNAKDDPNRFYYRSDHYNFAKNNIPVIFYFNGTHEDYHQATDTPDKIAYDVMEKRARAIFATAWELANRDNRPSLDEGSDK